MKFKVITCGQFTAPGVINDYCCTELSSLDNCLNFTAILRALPRSLCEEEIDRSLLVSVATLEKGVSVKDEAQTIFCSPAFG